MQNEEYKIFDCHLHVDKGLDGYDIQLSGANVIFNYVEDYFKHLDSIPAESSVSLIFDYKSNWDRVKDIVMKDNIKALKIHSRIQKLADNDYPTLNQHLMQTDPKLHVIYDAFYYGKELQFQPSLGRLVEMISSNSERKFIVAHSGGHRILDYLLHLRSFRNVYYDLSFSLSYLKDTSVYKDFIHFVNVTPKDRILFGTDFPNIGARNQLQCAMDICKTLNLDKNDIERILYANSKELFIGNENTIQ